MKIILVDARESFRDDIRTRLMIDDERNVELVSDLPSAAGLDAAMKNFDYDIVAVCDNVFYELNDWKVLGDKLIGYTAKDGEDSFKQQGVPSYGYVTTAAHLLNMLELGLPEAPSPVSVKTKQTVETVKVPEAEEEEEEKEEETIEPVTSPAEEIAPTHTPSPKLKPEPTAAKTVTSDEKPMVETPVKSNSVKARIDAARITKADTEASSFLKKELEKNLEPQKAKVVTVYSAKGGVGKTTMATELAVYLSMTSKGRSNYRVCIVDYNIDFGDVLTTLDFSPDGQNLSFWAAEIRERLARGETQEDIQYSREDIEEFLQKTNQTGLFGLVAPITHEDSMDIESDELGIILKNIVNNGGFDFVICDTGNNTRDSSVIALEEADYVLLMATQDVSTASCNDAFLTTMKKIGFDTGKIRLVINDIMPYKYTQVAVKEIEDMFPYGCVARIKRDPDVIRANNCSQPLVYQMNHEFTKEIRNIVQFLTGHAPEVEEKKKNLFSSLFGKKG